METANECQKAPTRIGPEPIERLYTAHELARATGGTVPEEFIRSACRRASGCHPLPHIETGLKRKIVRIRLSDFERWIEEEARL
jgi:hypothetical protein